MIVAFPFSFQGDPPPMYRGLAEKFCHAARDAGARVYQVSDTDTPMVSGADRCFRYERKTTFAEWYFGSMYTFPEDEFLRLDCDVLIRELPTEVFAQPFEIAIAKENKGAMNNGVVFVRDRNFAKDCYYAHQDRTSRNEWNDIQVAIQMVINDGSYNVLRLDPDVYNFMPQKHGEYGNAKLVHFEGQFRKAWM